MIHMPDSSDALCVTKNILIASSTAENAIRTKTIKDSISRLLETLA